MSLDLNVYVAIIDNQIIPAWIKEMNEFDMECEIHPNFSFTDHSGFLPLKVKLSNPINPELKGRELISGFEFYKDKFDFLKEIEKKQPNLTFEQKFLGKNIETVNYVNPQIDARLANCKWMLTFNWGSHNSLEMRMSVLSSAIITKLSNGVCSYPNDNIWYENTTIVEDAYQKILQFENSLKSNEWKIHDFVGWN